MWERAARVARAWSTTKTGAKGVVCLFSLPKFYMRPRANSGASAGEAGRGRKGGGRRFALFLSFCATLTKGEGKNREICELIFSMNVCYNF